MHSSETHICFVKLLIWQQGIEKIALKPQLFPPSEQLLYEMLEDWWVISLWADIQENR